MVGIVKLSNHTICHHDFDSNHGDVSIVNVVINSHTLSQCDDSSTFKDMDVDVENGDVSSENGSLRSHNFYQLNGMK